MIPDAPNSTASVPRSIRATSADVLPAREEVYTARQFAFHLQLTDRAIRERLAGTSHVQDVRGQKTRAWPLSALPEKWRQRLESLRAERNLRTVHDLLISDEERTRWTAQEENPLIKEIAADFMGQALRRGQVYQAALERELQFPAPARSEILTIVREKHKAVFGYDVSDDRHDYLLKVARGRDRGFGEFHRAELYLDAAAFRKTAPKAEDIAARSLHAPLLTTVEELSDRAFPDADDLATLYDRAFRHYEGLCAVTSERSEHLRIKRTLLDWLLEVFPCPILSTTPDGLRKSFDREMARWIAGDRQLESLLPRYHNGGRPARVCKPCLAKVNKRARQLRGQGGMGNTTLAYRQLRTSGELCAACCGHFKFNVAENKSYVPRTFRIHATPNALELGKDRGQKHMEAVGPKIMRDWSDTNPGDYYVGDDETSNHIVHTRIDGELVIGRLQILHLMDLTTMNPLDFVTYFGPPLATMNRKLIYQVCVEGAGLPRIGFLFEKGVYAARMLVGAKERKTSLPWAFSASGLMGRFGVSMEELTDDARQTWGGEHEDGLGEPGLDLAVRQATRAWSKPIEGCFHIFQKMMSGLRGFVGFQERDEIPDRLKDFVRRCKAGAEDPNQEFPSLDEYVTKYRAVLDEFRHEPQPKSKRLRGSSPLLAWNHHLATHPLRKLPPEMAYLLATHKKPVKLDGDGIVIDINGTRHSFANGRLGEWYGRGIKEVLAFYNIEFPHLLHVSDMKRRNFITLRNLAAPATTAHRTPSGRARLSECQKNKRDYMAAATQRFSGLEQPLINTITRDNDHSDEAKALGRHINETTEAERTAQASSVDARPAINRLAEAHGLSVSADAAAPVRRAVMSEKEKSLRERIAARSSNSTTTAQ